MMPLHYMRDGTIVPLQCHLPMEKLDGDFEIAWRRAATEETPATVYLLSQPHWTLQFTSSQDQTGDLQRVRLTS